jgi:hypothetical protein
MVYNPFVNRTFNAGKLSFKQTADGLAVVLPGSKRAIVHILPDLTYPTMWRVCFPDGRLSAMANKPRAKDAALLHAASLLNQEQAASIQNGAHIAIRHGSLSQVGSHLENMGPFWKIRVPLQVYGSHL